MVYSINRIHFIVEIVHQFLFRPYHGYVCRKQNNTLTTATATTAAAAERNAVKLLADMVSNRLHDAVNLLEITSKDPIIQNVTFANLITKKYMGMPSKIDMEKEE